MALFKRVDRARASRPERAPGIQPSGLRLQTDEPTPQPHTRQRRHAQSQHSLRAECSGWASLIRMLRSRPRRSTSSEATRSPPVSPTSQTVSRSHSVQASPSSPGWKGLFFLSCRCSTEMGSSALVRHDCCCAGSLSHRSAFPARAATHTTRVAAPTQLAPLSSQLTLSCLPCAVASHLSLPSAAPPSFALDSITRSLSIEDDLLRDYQNEMSAILNPNPTDAYSSAYAQHERQRAAAFMRTLALPQR